MKLKFLTTLSGAISLLFVWGAAPRDARGTEPDEIAAIEASADGRYIAVAKAAGELGILDLKDASDFPIYTRHLSGGFGWSPDSKILAYTEQIPGHPPEIWTVNPQSKGPAQLLLGGDDWKGQPHWLAPNEIAYRSDRDSDHVNLWSVTWSAGEGTTSTLIHPAAKLLDADGDILAFWSSPRPRILIYSAQIGGKTELWLWNRDGGKAEPITHDPPEQDFYEDALSFSSDGSRIAFWMHGEGKSEAVYYDLAFRRPLASTPLAQRPRGTLVLGDGRVLMDLNSAIQIWDPAKRFGAPLSPPRLWNGVGMGLATPLTLPAIAVIVNRKLIVTADSISKLDNGKIHTTRLEDLLDLSVAMQEKGKSREAESLLDTLWENNQTSAGPSLSIAATRAWIERLRVKPRYSEQWLERTIALADPNSQEFTAAWHTRLLIALFEEKNPRKARAILEALPESAANHALVEWIRELLDSEDAKMTERWRKVVDGLRQRKWTSCADALSAAIAADPRSEINRRGAALLLRGGLQPIVSSTMEEPITYPELMNEQAFQQAMLLLCGGDLSADMGKDDLRGYLLLQWARAQQTDAARSLVLMDLSDPSGSSLDYMDILNRYLNAEEQDQWVDKAVGEILLWPRNAYLLNRHLSDAKGHLVLMLARAKHALIRGEIRGGREKAENLESILGQIDDDLNLISPDFWNPETGRLLFLIRLYQAKLYERDGKWDFALAAYSQALDVLNRFPGDWEITAFDITAFKSLIEAGRADGDLLRLYLQTVAGMGDPLVNPPYAPDMAGTAAANIKTLEKHGVTDPARDRWLLPFLLYSAAGCQSLAGRPYEAIARLEAARRADPPEALLARILVEEAAVRATLRQHRMAARLLADLSALPLDPPRLAVAIKTRAQAESDAGMTASQSDRMRELAAELKLPAVWRRTILGEEDSRKPPEEKVMPR